MNFADLFADRAAYAHGFVDVSLSVRYGKSGAAAFKAHLAAHAFFGVDRAFALEGGGEFCPVAVREFLEDAGIAGDDDACFGAGDSVVESFF